ncbi:UDP-N-acetylglucosamine 1-carboxyvinyltransferase [Propionibacterium cyclohexanicum]|uniref:UDP-N-acetylglucosamine 1-carboxyvinyltransferase n=1 Tax=Propionibacterium cyclohexanicum TaxID=64702 RepID=A0A1H9TG92_9ACTN|nr:UDP-N-acetylglucosamine 1-carboxyvinyltransferase [Propionibacterium cyclohexanicum]SER95643.1 UDP-N-acetylglucosamine 1-carboxyvinyltransferase [Propionibacterium cyclohexanicum]
MTQQTTPASIGRLIRDARKQRGLTQNQLAEELSTSQSAIHRIESGGQNLSLETINKIAAALESPLIVAGKSGTLNLRIEGGTRLAGSIETRSSKNAAVALLCASLLNRGRTVLKGIAHIEEVNRLLEVLTSIGVETQWSADGKDLTLHRPESLSLDTLDVEAARRTRSIIMFMGPLSRFFTDFKLPYAGGCNLGVRTVEPHMHSLSHFGLSVHAGDGHYHVKVSSVSTQRRHIVLTERGDTVTENTLMAAAIAPGVTVIRNASPNYMVQDLCAFLMLLGVQIDGVGTTTLTVRGLDEAPDIDVSYEVSEDPIEAMSLITAAVVTTSELTITRAPIEFLEIELAILGEEMGLHYDLSEEYRSGNGLTRLVDITVHPSELRAPKDKIHPMPFPGLNIDNLPFFAVLAATADGQTMIHDWVYDNRAIHLLLLNQLGARVQLLDPHRLIISGPTGWRSRDMVSPPALRPAVCVLLAMLAGKGTSVLRDVYVINRGYEDLPTRLNALGAHVEPFYE